MPVLTYEMQELAGFQIPLSYGEFWVCLEGMMTEQDPVNNRTYCRFRCTYLFTGEWMRDDNSQWSVSCTNLPTASGTKSDNYIYGRHVIGQTEGWIEHDAEGKRDLFASASISLPYFGGSGTAETWVTIPTIYKGYVHINDHGTWKNAVPFVKVDGTWKQAMGYVNDHGTWKMSG